MDDSAKLQLRQFLIESLINAGDRHEFSDDSSLFASGRLDSLSMTKLVVFLEDAFGIDFVSVDFDVDMIDSFNDIQSFIRSERARRA